MILSALIIDVAGGEKMEIHVGECWRTKSEQVFVDIFRGVTK
jgi:hypothetical protein